MIDLQAVYERGLRTLHERGSRSDEHLLHLGGDLAGICDHASWARRKYHSGKLVLDALTNAWVNPHERLKPATPDAQSIVAMQLGFKVEALIVDATAEGLSEGMCLDLNVGCALILTEEGLQGKLFDEYTGHQYRGHKRHRDPHDEMIEFAETHEGVAVGHIDAVLHSPDWTEALVVDAKSTVWSDSYKTGERVWSTKYGPKDSHVLQVSQYALAVALTHPDCAVRAGLLELDLGGKATRWSEVDWNAQRTLIARRLSEASVKTDPSCGPPATVPNPWTMKRDGTSWACGSPTTKAYCPQTSCERHALNGGAR